MTTVAMAMVMMNMMLEPPRNFAVARIEALC
jgi:hypothetical protein